jgi:hypothetical protein
MSNSQGTMRSDGVATRWQKNNWAERASRLRRENSAMASLLRYQPEMAKELG